MHDLGAPDKINERQQQRALRGERVPRSISLPNFVKRIMCQVTTNSPKSVQMFDCAGTIQITSELLVSSCTRPSCHHTLESNDSTSCERSPAKTYAPVFCSDNISLAGIHGEKVVNQCRAEQRARECHSNGKNGVCEDLNKCRRRSLKLLGVKYVNIRITDCKNSAYQSYAAIVEEIKHCNPGKGLCYKMRDQEKTRAGKGQGGQPRHSEQLEGGIDRHSAHQQC